MVYESYCVSRVTHLHLSSGRLLDITRMCYDPPPPWPTQTMNIIHVVRTLLFVQLQSTPVVKVRPDVARWGD